jgi:tetratricopeptide (TPR) repeat protein
MAELAQLARTIRGAASRVRRPVTQRRYMAFFSYSHQDGAIAEWLHEELEEFRVPPRLIGKLTEHGPVPKRLAPIFRDRQELAAASDLSEEIEEAIAGSRFLVVLCSPAAARSRWIDQEIACFKKLHREDRILAAIVDGEPFASDDPDRAAEECFPPALRVHFDRRGKATTQRAEPIAADLREQGDGRRMGLLKLAAGMIGVGLDDLAQREAQRRHRRLYAITAASVVGMLFASGLAYTAIDARDQARDQRREAEGLVGFMLGDLRHKLEPLGRLDLMDSVGARALAYYESQDKSDLSNEALAQRSRALTLMGEMAFTRGDLDRALRLYREAMASTGEAVRRDPDRPQNLFDHAQNVFWTGYVDYQRGSLDKAAVAFQEYRRLAERMIKLAPNDPRYQLERIYAETNLGTVLMEQRKYRAAATAYQASLEPIESLVAKAPGNSDYRTQLVDTLAWLADARESSGQLDEALAHRSRQIDLLAKQWQVETGNTTIKRIELTARRALARLLAERGDLAGALNESRRASAVIDWLTKTEPANTEWLQAGANANFDRADLELAANRIEEGRSVAESACAITSQLVARDRSVAKWRTDMQLRCLDFKSRIAMQGGQRSEAADFARQALALASTEPNPVARGFKVASAERALGDALSLAGQKDAAQGAYRRALAAWPNGVEEQPREMANRSILLGRLGRHGEADELAGRLAAMGYRYPSFRRERLMTTRG